jgi:nitronate monooxygenase
LAARERGDFNTAAVIAGESAGLVRDVPTAGELVRRIMAEANDLMANASHRADGEAPSSPTRP